MGNGGFKQKQNEVDAERDPGRAEVEGVIRKTCSKVIARESDEAVNTLLAHATSEYDSGACDHAWKWSNLNNVVFALDYSQVYDGLQ